MNTSLFDAPSASNTEMIRKEIKARGLTAQQASEKYGLGPDMMDWLMQNGISFAPEGAKPQGLMDAAAQGRNGDTMMAHVTPGEKVVPREVAQGRPDVMANVDQAIAQMGADPSKYTVGSGSKNPQTGAEEFATAVTNDQITGWLAQNPNATDSQIADQADAYGVTPERLAGATGGNAAEIRRRYDAVRATPVATPGSGISVPTASQSTPNRPMSASSGSAQGYTASFARPAANVTAGTGTAGTYSATDAAASLRPDASLWDVDDRSTVQGQIRNIVDENGPLSQRATTRATQEANKRGLANSSMAVTAGQAALYDAALPIAQQDANTYAQSGQYNAGARNERDQFNAGTQTQVNLTNAGEQNKAGAFNAQSASEMTRFNIDSALKAGVINQEQANKMAQFNATSANEAARFTAGSANEMAQFNAGEANKLAMFQSNLNADIAKFNASENNDLIALGMDSQTKTTLAEIEANYKTLMQTSASGSEVYKGAMTQIAQILQNADMDEAAKKTAVDNITQMLNASLGVVGQISNLDLPELDFGGEPAPAATPAPGGGLIDSPSGSGYVPNQPVTV